MPKMTHPKSNLTIDAAPDMVRMYASQGWVEKTTAPKKPRKPRAPRTQTSARPTNPAPAAETKE